jgi:hypothetical protein
LVNLVRSHIREVCRLGNVIVAKPSIVIGLRVHNSHDSEVIRTIVAPRDSPKAVVCVFCASDWAEISDSGIGRCVVDQAVRIGVVSEGIDGEVIEAGAGICLAVCWKLD